MKNLVYIVIGSLLSAPAFADCVSAEWNLPNKGTDCVHLADFGSPISGKLYSCLKNGGKELVLVNGVTMENGDNEACFVRTSVQIQNSVLSNSAKAAIDPLCIPATEGYLVEERVNTSEANKIALQSCGMGVSLKEFKRMVTWRRSLGDYPDTSVQLAALLVVQGVTLDCVYLKLKSEFIAYPDLNREKAIRQCIAAPKPDSWPSQWPDYWNQK